MTLDEVSVTTGVEVFDESTGDVFEVGRITVWEPARRQSDFSFGREGRRTSDRPGSDDPAG